MTSLLFVDFSEAYDRVDRRLLLERINRKSILTPERQAVLRFLLTNCETQMGGRRTRLTNGVPQGSTVAPLLYDISQ
jgi:hypothetical protein